LPEVQERDGAAIHDQRIELRPEILGLLSLSEMSIHDAISIGIYASESDAWLAAQRFPKR
jgi:hypothetical protein